MAEVGWAFNALQTRETWERLAGLDTRVRRGFDSRPWTVTARAGFMVMSGALIGADGTVYTPTELVELLPVDRR